MTAAISNKITPGSGFAAVIWPPMGIAIAGLLLERKKTLLAVFLASLIFSFRPSEASMITTLSIATAETLGALLGATLIRKTPNFDWSFTSTIHVWRFLVTTVISVSLITPLIGSPVLWRSHALHGESFASNFITWWFGNALGILIFTPFIMIVTKDAIWRAFTEKKIEFIVLGLIAILLCSYLFIDTIPIDTWMTQAARRVYVLFPVVLWCAIRFGPVGTAFLMLGIAGFATYGAISDSAVFASDHTPETFNSVQLYLGFLAATGFLVAAHITQSHRNEARFRSMFEMAGVPSTLVSKDGRFDLVNDQFCQMTGYTRDDLKTMSFRNITHPDDVEESTRLFQDLMSGRKKHIHFEKRYIIKNGDIIWSLIDAALINHSAKGEQTSIAIVQDITTRKLAELAAEKAKKDAEEANQAKTEFLAFMSHEIRTPLGVILGFAEILKEKTIDQNLRDEFADTIHRNAVELGSLIDDVLDISKVEAGRVELAREVVDVVDLIRDIKSSFSLSLDKKNIKLSISIDDSVPSAIVSDHKVLRQILINIIGNAIKHTENGGISLRVHLDENKDSDQRLVTFTISDTGCGILESEQDKIFTRYGQSSCPTASKAKSTGLGLVLSKHLAQLLGGDVELKESKPGEGSTFVITVNSELAHDPTLSIANSTKTNLRKRLDGVKILVAEDTPDQAFLIKFLLADVGAIVTIVNNGAAAVEKTLSHSFDIILMDMQMPILDGLEACKILRRQGFQKPIIALTAQALKTDTGHSLHAGCTRHISKPFTQERLIKAIAETLPP